MVELHALGRDLAGGRLADVVQQRGQPQDRARLGALTTARVCRSTSLCRCTGSCSRRSAGSSGRNSSARPVSTIISRPRSTSSARSRRVSSSLIRSAEMIRSRSRISPIEAISSGAGSTPSVATNLAARSIRRGSSENEISWVQRGAEPPMPQVDSPRCGSTNSPSGSRTAMALIVKSRRERSVSMSLAYVTTGWRRVLPVHVLAERGDLERDPRPARPDRSVLHADQVLGVRPPLEDRDHLWGSRVGGEIEVVAKRGGRAASRARRRRPGTARGRPSRTSRRAPWRPAGSRGGRRWAAARPRGSPAEDTLGSRCPCSV